MKKNKCGEEVINQRDSNSSSCINGKLRETEKKKNKKRKTINDSPAEIPVPCRYIFVCQTSSDIKHDDSTLSMNTENQTVQITNVKYERMKG